MQVSLGLILLAAAVLGCQAQGIQNPVIPEAPATCFQLQRGAGIVKQEVAVDVSEGVSRQAIVYWKPDQNIKFNGDAPVMLYFHGTYGNPNLEPYFLATSFNTFLDEGGIIVAPRSDIGPSEFEWHIVRNRTAMNDMIMVDAIVSCLMQTKSFSMRRIHAAGFSAGGIQTTWLSVLRRQYIASVASFSGGLSTSTVPGDGETLPVPAALVIHGGRLDRFDTSTFQEPSERFFKYVQSKGSAAVICNHGLGHLIARMQGTDAVSTFFKDNTYATSSPKYSPGTALDRAHFASYCQTSL
ncbi:hypothetical protein HDU85_005417 [Gaertneriomyces sp. JEL0708]|nr:hypothetical protein HDU85_005417 [Gaertneriomyces sp. JEL0708]